MFPTRELSMHTFLESSRNWWNIIIDLLMNGANRQTEAQKLRKGINIIVAMSERLLDHLQNTPDFLYKNFLNVWSSTKRIVFWILDTKKRSSKLSTFFLVSNILHIKSKLFFLLLLCELLQSTGKLWSSAPHRRKG